MVSFRGHAALLPTDRNRAARELDEQGRRAIPSCEAA